MSAVGHLEKTWNHLILYIFVPFFDFLYLFAQKLSWMNSELNRSTSCFWNCISPAWIRPLFVTKIFDVNCFWVATNRCLSLPTCCLPSLLLSFRFHRSPNAWFLIVQPSFPSTFLPTTPNTHILIELKQKKNAFLVKGYENFANDIKIKVYIRQCVGS